MEVRFLRDWKRCRVGQVKTWLSRGAAHILIRRGIVEEVMPEPEEPPRVQRSRTSRKVRA